MKNTLKRVCIYPKDIQVITGRSYRQSVRLHQKIKKALNKEKDQFVTLEEFCSFVGIKEESVNQFK